RADAPAPEGIEQGTDHPLRRHVAQPAAVAQVPRQWSQRSAPEGRFQTTSESVKMGTFQRRPPFDRVQPTERMAGRRCHLQAPISTENTDTAEVICSQRLIRSDL